MYLFDNCIVLAHFWFPTVSLIAIFSLIFLSSPFITLIMALELTSVTCGSIGLMSLWGIPLNSMTIQVILVSLPYAATICFAASYHFLNNSFSNDRERSAFAFLAFAGPTLKSGFLILCGFLPLLAVPAPFVGDLSKLFFISIGLILFHSLFFLPPILPLLAINLPFCCNEFFHQMTKGFFCCSPDEDVSSIYYLPTGAKEIQAEEIEKIYASLRLQESINSLSQLALPGKSAKNLFW